MIRRVNENFGKTKILTTLGPATATPDKLKELIAAGADGVRLNFSHGDYAFFEKLFLDIDKTRKETVTPLAVLLDLQGPKIRIGELSAPEIPIQTGDTIELTTEKMQGTKDKVYTSYTPLPQDGKIGDIILIDDGLLRLRIIKKTNNSVICEIENGGILKPKKGMNLPGMNLSTASVTEKDFNDLEFALKFDIDYVALSFVRQASDITGLKSWMAERGFNVPIIAKIEKKEAVDNFDEILKVADGIMVARGDLGVEMHPQDVPVIQKNIIKKCNSVGKIVITATQMLESMIVNPIPTRAEASDVANAVWDGTDVVMLSAETSVGKYPNKTVETMNNIILRAECSHNYSEKTEYSIPTTIEENLFDSVNHAICNMAEQTHPAAIVVFTHLGRAAMSLSKFRPQSRIIAICDSHKTMNRLSLKWGVTSLFAPVISKEQAVIEGVKKMIVESGHVKKGDLVLFTAGAPYSEKSRLNWMKFEEA